MKRFIFIAAAMLATLFAMAQGQRPQQPQMPENVAYVEYNMKMGEVEGRSYNHAPTFFIYPDTKLDEAGAKALVEEFDMKDVLTRPSDQETHLSWEVKEHIIYFSWLAFRLFF